MSTQGQAYLYGLGAVLCWSTVATAFKLSLAYLTPAQLLLCASITSWFLLGGTLWWQGKLKLLAQFGQKEVSFSLIMGLINPFLYYLVLFKAYDLLPAQEAQALNYTWALTMSLLAIPLLKQRLKASELAASLICYAGVLVIATRGNVGSLDFANGTGVGLALLSTLLWSFYWILNTRDQREPVAGLFLNFSIAIPFIVLYCAFTGELTHLPFEGIAGAVYIGVFEMGLSFILWLKAMKLTSSTAKISNLIFISPFISLVLIAFILKEEILPSTLTGLVLILFGLAIHKIDKINT
jgi:drug/metabolite transporter (DMT)-like permease